MQAEVDNKKYDDILTDSFFSGAFLQSHLWMDFLAAQEKRFWQIIVTENESVLAKCLLYENKLAFGKSYLYAPKGPVFKNDLSDEQTEEAAKLILSKIRDISINTKRREEVFLKIEPSQDIAFIEGLQDTGNIQPRDTIYLELNKNHAEILASMHPKTRYNIMLATKKGVLVEASEEEKSIETFLALNKKTAARQNIVAHADDYYRLLWKVFLEHRAAKIYLAKVGDKVVAANLQISFGKTSTYLHGASDYQYRSFMAPYLLQWQAIKDAMADGALYYDFWGIAPNDNSKVNWQGFTRFKKGFSGKVVSSPKAQVFIYQSGFYQAYNFAKKLRKFFK